MDTTKRSIDKVNISNFIIDVDTNISMNDVILSDENKYKINSIIEEIEAREKLILYGIKPSNRVLCSGDSGTGKTYLGKALAKLLNYEMMYIDIAAALNNGNVTDNIRNVFEYANSTGNCLLFFDECDSIAWSRDRQGDGTDSARMATNTIFQQLDQFNPNNLFMSATNMLHRIDPAFLRRFSIKMEFRNTGDVGYAIDKFSNKFIDNYKVKFNRNMLDSDRQLMQRKLSGILSYEAIKNAVEKAVKTAILKDSDINSEVVMNETDIYNALALEISMTKKF